MVSVAAEVGWYFLLGVLQQPEPVTLSGVLWLAAMLHLNCPHAAGGTSRSDPNQHTSACRSLERFARHPSARGLLVLLALSALIFSVI